MENKIFYIYEVKGIKNGCTTQWDKRSEQNFKKYNITPVVVETYQYPNTAEYWQMVGDREWELAELNGYPKGTHYRTAMEQRSIGGKLGAKAQPKSVRIAMGNKAWKINLLPHSIARRKLTFETAQYIRAQYARKIDVFGKPISSLRLSRVFNVAKPAILRIIHNKTYINQ